MESARASALAFLKRHRMGILASTAAGGHPHASAVYYEAEDDFSVYFTTRINSRKYIAMSAEPRIAFVVSTEDVPQTIQMEGIAVDISRERDASKHKEKLFTALDSNAFFYPPISKLDSGTSVIMMIRPTWVRWADYAFAKSGTSNVLIEIPVGEPRKQ